MVQTTNKQPEAENKKERKEHRKTIIKAIQQDNKQLQEATILLRKHRDTILTKLKSAQSLAPHKPILLIILRENGSVNIMEGVRLGTISIIHSNGTELRYELGPHNIWNLPYGNDTTKMAIIYENMKFSPFPFQLSVQADMFRIIIEKLFTDKNSLEVAKRRAAFAGWVKILTIVALVIGGYLLYMFLTQDKTPAAQAVQQAPTIIGG